MASDWSVGVEVGYVAEDGTRHRVTLADAWAVRFEAMAPARGRDSAAGFERGLSRKVSSLTVASHDRLVVCHG